MKNLLLLSTALLGLVTVASGQGIKSDLSGDTLAYRITSFRQPPPFGNTDLLFFQPTGIITTGIHPSFSLLSLSFDSPSKSWMLSDKKDILSPLRLQLQSEEKYSILWSVLGAVEAGGAGYLAYKYIEKHGLK